MRYAIALVSLCMLVCGFNVIILKNEIGMRPALFCGLLGGVIVVLLVHICVNHNIRE